MEQNVLPVLSGTVLFIVVCIKKKKTWMSWKLSICSVAYIDFIQDGCYFFFKLLWKNCVWGNRRKDTGKKEKVHSGFRISPLSLPRALLVRLLVLFSSEAAGKMLG